MESENNNKNQYTMKKQIMTIAIVLGLSMTSFAQGGLFHRGANADGTPAEVFHRGANADGTPAEVSLTGDGTKGPGDNTPMLPIHNQDGEQPAPLGSGIALLTALGAGYMVAKRRREE